MDTFQLAMMSLLIGVILGGSVAAVVVAAYRARDRALAQGSAQVPDGAREVISALADAAVLVDPSGTILAASAPARALALREGRGIAPVQLALLARAALAGTAPDAVIMPMAETSAAVRIVSVHARAVTSRLVLVLLRDVTAQEQTERMRRDFVENTSHELKTPAAAVSLLAEAVDAAADDPAQVRAFARRLQDEGRRLAELTSRIMRLSRLQSEEALEMTEVAVDDVIHDAVARQAERARASGITVTAGPPQGVWVLGDAEMLGDAVGNLVANAITYSPAGAAVGVGVRADDLVVEISVSDQGIGIDEADQERVFERFYRADPARSRRTGGTGLGLAIVRHAVHRHGGVVRLWSRPGQGSTFTVRLPRAQTPATAANAAKTGKPSKAAEVGRPPKAAGANRHSEAARVAEHTTPAETIGNRAEPIREEPAA